MSSSMSKDLKKKLDEKVLKSLKELASLSHNRCCSDCGQKGPTYVNITIGTFVCTSCSGILRGLIPPHRVKSISMATFTQDEVDYLRTHGNRYCDLVYMSLFNTSQSTSLKSPDARDMEKLKDFLTQKYEKKRWYTPPSDILLTQIKLENEQSTHNFTLKQQTPTRSALKRKDSLVSDKTCSSIGESISSFDQVFKMTAQEEVSQNEQEQINFANFDMFDQFVSNSPPKTHNSYHTTPSVTQQQALIDKYSALAELDSIFTPLPKQQNQQHTSYFNPFQAPTQYQAPVHMTNPFMMSQIQHQQQQQQQQTSKISSFNPFL